MEKCQNTQRNKIDGLSLRRTHKHHSGAGTFYTSSAGTIVALILFFAISLFISNNTYATESILSLSIDNTTAGLDISSVSNDGTFAKSNVSTITASTNNMTGYTLSIAASSSTNYDKLMLQDQSAYISSIGNRIAEDDFSASAQNNVWGYIPSKYNSQDNTTTKYYYPAPDTSGAVLNSTDCANGLSDCPAEDIYTIGFGVRVDASTKIGTYSNTYIVQLVADAVPYSIAYMDNAVSNVPVNVTGTAEGGTNVTVSSNIPVRNGYTFNGWCKVVPTINADGVDTCPSGQSVAAGGTLTVSDTSVNNFTLYAMWKENYTIDALLASGTLYMQDFNTMSADKKAKVVASMVVGTAYTLTDSRSDKATYKVAKLKDGNVWMLDNLRLGGSSTIALNPSDTNINTNWTLPASVTSGFDTYTAARINANYKATVATNHYGQGSGYIGVYYNYCAISAGTYCYDTYSGGVDIPNTIVDSPQDICPAGWRLPTGGTAGDFQNLHSYYNTTGIASYPDSLQYNLSMAFGGAFLDSSQRHYPEEGWLPTSTYYNINVMYRLIAAANYVNPADNSNGYAARLFGWTIRCLMR